MDRSRVMGAFLLLSLLVGLGYRLTDTSAVALAAQGPSCSFYDYQSDAQYDFDRVLEEYPSIVENYRNLDIDDDGIACQELPQRPQMLMGTERIRGNFDDNSDFLSIDGAGYSAEYAVTIAGVSVDRKSNDASESAECPEVTGNEALKSLFALPDVLARQFYIESSNDQDIPPTDADGTFDVSALVWTVAGDPSAPILLNTWLVRNGLTFASLDTVSGDLRDELRRAQRSAEDEVLGVWGACRLPSELVPPPAAPDGQVLQASGSGDQVQTFTVASEGTYVLTLEVNGGAVVFCAVDVYNLDGTWIPGLSVSTADGGRFTSAEYLIPGEYFVEVTSIGSWRITLDLLA